MVGGYDFDMVFLLRGTEAGSRIPGPGKATRRLLSGPRAWKKGSLVGGGGLGWLDHKKTIKTNIRKV